MECAGSSEADEIYKICSIMGTPNKQSWAEGMKLAANMNFRFPQFSASPLGKHVPSASPEAIDLLTGLCAWCASSSCEPLAAPHSACTVVQCPTETLAEYCSSHTALNC